MARCSEGRRQQNEPTVAVDPTQSFDADGNLFYGFICFNRSKPINGGVYVAKYTDHGATYERTVLVKQGSPSGLFGAGLFQDKINLTADQTDGEFAGNVYTAWSQYHGLQSGNNAVLFARSTHHGLSYSRPGNDADGVNSGDVVQARVAQSSDGGETWSEQVVSTAGSKLRVDDPWVPARRVLG